jgi:hypothetical protein
MTPMADIKSNDVSEHKDVNGNFYTGTRKALIAAKICQPEWFPRKLERDARIPTRTKRSYRVEGAKLETILTHRRNGEGVEYWVVRVALTEQERARREAAQKAEWAEQQRSVEEAERRRELEKEAAAPIVSELRRRYSTLPFITGAIAKTEDGKRQNQSVEFYARDLDSLKRYGLVTEKMLDERYKSKHHENWFSGDLPNGESFFLHEEGNAKASYWMLIMHSYECPRERKNFPVTEARKVLKQIAARG